MGANCVRCGQPTLQRVRWYDARGLPWFLLPVRRVIAFVKASCASPIPVCEACIKDWMGEQIANYDQNSASG